MPKKYLFLLFSILPYVTFAQTDTLLNEINILAKEAKGKVCVYAHLIEDSVELNYYGDELCVMQSVFKIPIALHILDKIDKGEFSLLHKIHIPSKKMIKETWSPMRDSFPDGNVNMTFDKLLSYMVSQSDNIACDVLINHIGKPVAVQKYIRKSGFEDFEMKYNEAAMHKKWKNQYSNVCSAKMMTQLLTKFYKGQLLSKTNTDYLYQLMTASTSGANRIKKYLPEDIIVANKTGTSATNSNGMTAAVNDVGIIHLPNGKHLVLSVFICDAYADYNSLEDTIAKISKLIYDVFKE